MVSINWCKQQKNGLRITDPNEIISKDYMRKADAALHVMTQSPSKEWKAVTAYYACYDALYSLLQKTGIVCEIHDCTIALMPFFDFSNEEISFITDLKLQRINAQYYVNKDYTVADENAIKDFVLLCKKKTPELDFESIHQKVQEA